MPSNGIPVWYIPGRLGRAIDVDYFPINGDDRGFEIDYWDANVSGDRTGPHDSWGKGE